MKEKPKPEFPKIIMVFGEFRVVDPGPCKLETKCTFAEPVSYEGREGHYHPILETRAPVDAMGRAGWARVHQIGSNEIPKLVRALTDSLGKE